MMKRMRSPSKISGQHSVVVRLHRAILPPKLAKFTIRSLESTTRDFCLDETSGLLSKSNRHAFYVRDAEGYICSRAGLVPRIIENLRNLGIETPVEDRTRWPVLGRAAARLTEIASDYNRTLLGAVVANPRGQITAERGSNGVQQLVDVLDLFQGQRVLVVTRNREERDKLHRRLSSSLSRPVSTHRGVQWGTANRVTIITAHFFAGISVSNVDFDVVLFTHPHAVIGDHAFNTAVQLQHELLYCFTPAHYHTDLLSQLRLEAICGPMIYTPIDRTATVHALLLPGPPFPVHRPSSHLERKRNTIWNNDPRNDYVAELATAIAVGTVDESMPHGEIIRRAMELQANDYGPGIAILVESIEHGREFQRRLPKWELLTAIPDRDGVLESGSCHRSIVTETFSSMGIYADVLIRATGTSSPLVVKGFPSIEQRRPVMLVDLVDRFDAHSSRDTDARIRDYHARRWPVVGGDKNWRSGTT